MKLLMRETRTKYTNNSSSYIHYATEMKDSEHHQTEYLKEYHSLYMPFTTHPFITQREMNKPEQQLTVVEKMPESIPQQVNHIMRPF